jgi:hypothetical protein
VLYWIAGLRASWSLVGACIWQAWAVVVSASGPEICNLAGGVSHLVGAAGARRPASVKEV